MLFVLFLLFNDIYGQENSGGVPYLFQGKEVSDWLRTNKTYVSLPNIDNNAEQQRSEIASKAVCTNCDNPYYGKALDVSINVKQKGTLKTLKDGTKLWLLQVKSPTAYGLQFYFDKFKLPVGASLFIYNEEKNVILGSYTHKNNPSNTTKAIQFGTEFVRGKSIIIEYSEPSRVQFSGELSIKKIVHVFKDIFPKVSGPYGSALSCHKNVACPEGEGWEKEINSVAMILGINNSNNYAGWCSGAVINNTHQDGRSLFLSANHCIDGNITANSAFDYSTWLFLFNHQTTTCNSNGSEVSGYTGESILGAIPLVQDQSGSPTSDYLLLDLGVTKEKLISYGVCFAGWSLSASPQGEFMSIHHPAGDVKKLSIGQSVTSTFNNNTTTNSQGTHWMISWDANKGITEGGSSGGPLFDKNHRIIGQLHGGTSDCDTRGPDWYGKLKYTWDNSLIKTYLDPFNTGLQYMDTYCPEGAIVTDDTDEDDIGNPDYQPGTGEVFSLCNKSARTYPKDGFYVNGKDDELIEVCVNEDIIISARHHKKSCDPGSFIFKHEQKGSYNFGTCDDNESDPDKPAYECNPYLFDVFCECHYAILFISVTLCNDDLVAVGPEFSKLESFVAPDLETTSSGKKRLKSFNLLDHMPSPYITFQPGQIYQVKVSLSYYGGWYEYANYIHFYGDNHDIDGKDITYNVYGKKVSISNSTINKKIDVIANNSIEILPKTSFNVGKCQINPNLNCNDINASTGVGKKSWTKGNQNSYDSNYPDEDFDDTVEKLSSIGVSTVYPNPTNGEFTIDLGHGNDVAQIEVNDQLGRLILKKEMNQQLEKLDLTNYPKGIYFLKIKVGSDTEFKKIILE